MKRLVLLVLVLVLCSNFSPAQVPRSMSYQGVLTDTTGAPKPDGSYAFTFRLYDAGTGGNLVGTQTQTLPVKRGLFHTVLDQLLQGVSMDRPYWLSLQLGGEAELSPRIPLTAAPYSISASHADTARFAINSPPQGVVDSARIAGTLPNNAVTASKIASGQVVKSLNGLRDNVVLTATGGPTISSKGDSIVINNVAGWSLNGNSGTIAGSNFVGTTDAQAFDIHTNSTLHTRITTKGQIETYGTGGSVFLGSGAGANEDLADRRNVFVGEDAGFSTTSGGPIRRADTRLSIPTTTGYVKHRQRMEGSLFQHDRIRQCCNRKYGTLLHQYRDPQYRCGKCCSLWKCRRELQYRVRISVLFSRPTLSLIPPWATMPVQGMTTGITMFLSGRIRDVNGTGYFNVIAIGEGTIVGGSSTARFGNSATTSYGGWANWTNVSDGRFKKNVKTDVPGLAFITRLRPITYNLDATGLDAFLHRNVKPDLQLSTPALAAQARALQVKEAITYSGFVAQEVEAAAKEVGYDFSGVDAPKSANDYYGLRYADFVVPLVKAVQEQQQMIDAQQKEITELKAMVQSLTGTRK